MCEVRRGVLLLLRVIRYCINSNILYSINSTVEGRDPTKRVGPLEKKMGSRNAKKEKETKESNGRGKWETRLYDTRHTHTARHVRARACHACPSRNATAQEEEFEYGC